MKDFLKDRYNILAICFIAFGILIVFQLVNLQIINGQYYDEQSQKKILNERSIPAPRGNIKDRYGVPIAVNRVGYTAEMVRTKMTGDERNEMFLRLVNLFEKNGEDYIQSLGRYITIKPFAFGKELNTDKKLKKWKEEMAMDKAKKDVALMTNAQQTFKYLRKKFEIGEKYSDEDAYKIMCIKYEALIKGYTAINALTLAKDIKIQTVAELEEKHHEFPGVSTDTEPYRKYINGELTANFMGYVQGLSEKQYSEHKDEGYKMNDIIGQVGIEAAAEKFLKGKEGQKKVAVDITGRQIEQLEAEPAIPGHDVVLTIDMKLQKTAMESLQKNIELIKQQADGKKNFGDASAGAAVAMDVNTGEILAMASYPSYDPSVYLEGADNKEAQKKIGEYNDINALVPVSLNRATQGRYAPGSTFKPITSIAALEEGVIKPDTMINDPGYFDVGSRRFKCLEFKTGHGDLDLKHALETSCNIYFEKVGVSTGIDKIAKWAKTFGLGQYTGIDIPYERNGILASKQSKAELFKNSPKSEQNWYDGDTAQASIGQSFNLFTPLQLVNYTAALANGGRKMTPHLIKKVVKYDQSTVLEKKTEYDRLPVKKETLDAVKEGMKAVTQEENGTAVNVFSEFKLKTGYEVPGKTGTAETGNEKTSSSNSLFICYAPAEKPQIAVAVVIEHGVWGANSAYVARDILSEYFGVNSNNGTSSVLRSEAVRFTR